MTEAQLPISPHPVNIKRSDLRCMFRLARALYRLSENPGYRNHVAAEVPAAGRHNPGHAAVMMGYDFHLSPHGPRLIEVNTNAGGSFLALQNEHPDRRLRFTQRTLQTFLDEYHAFLNTSTTKPGHLAILDEDPVNQFLYPEMRAFAEMFVECGIPTHIVDPGDLRADQEGVFLGNDRVDMIYNRHCDFYLETPAMQGICAAYLSKSVCLTPNPFSYALLADKRRLPSWRDVASLAEWGLDSRQVDILQAMIPECIMLADMDREVMWREKKKWVFKPVTSFGSRGVLLGEKMTRSRYDQLDPAETLCQRAVAPQRVNTIDGKEFKADLRLFTYRDKLLGVTARLYRGQVTNMRTEEGGFARVELD